MNNAVKSRNPQSRSYQSHKYQLHKYQLHKYQLHKHSWNSKILPGCILMLSLLAASPAFAQYRPPSGASAPGGGGTTTTGRRGGCNGNAIADLTALAPSSHVGYTTSTRPTFAWFVPDARPFLLEFHLYEQSSSGSRELLYKTEVQSSPGIMSLSLPENQPALQAGQTYRWQVVLLCNPNRPSGALVANAELKVVASPPELESALSTAAIPAERSTVYAEQGFWYDALAEALQANSETKRPLLELLEDLAETEAAAGRTAESTRLRQAITVEQQ